MKCVLSCMCVCVCGVCIYGIIGRERYVIDKLWRKKPAVLSSDLKLEAQSKARINRANTDFASFETGGGH